MAKLREAQRLAVIEKDRLEKEKHELLTRVSPPRPVSVPSSEYKEKAERLGALYSTRGDTSSREELYRLYKDPEAVKWFRQAGQQGDAVAQVMLGRMFQLGLEVPQDYQEALKWFRKAADQGNAIAQNNLGLMYHNGWGVAKNYSEAVKWYKKAAGQGWAWAQSNLGDIYSNGYGVPKDRREAIKWYKQAADQGNEYAKKELRKLGVAGK